MSQEQPSSRKEKKALRDAERHKKGSKRKRAEDDDIAADPAEGAAAPVEEQSKSSKKSRKRKASAVEPEKGGVKVDDSKPADSEPKPKKRKQAKVEGRDGEGEGDADDGSGKPTKSRFIVFVGNLPYKTTDDSLLIHFKKLQPFNLRHRTDPKTLKSRGFAFLEFENYDRMKTCLKLYHHSMFDPADPTKGEDGIAEEGAARREKNGARKINVELTAGGGGKTEGRKAKIKAKNERLDEQRKRRADTERQEKAKKEKKERREAKKSGKPPKEEKNEQADAGVQIDSSSGIHPSRLARINI